MAIFHSDGFGYSNARVVMDIASFRLVSRASTQGYCCDMSAQLSDIQSVISDATAGTLVFAF
jgi:hypothetical protein